MMDYTTGCNIMYDRYCNTDVWHCTYDVWQIVIMMYDLII